MNNCVDLKLEKLEEAVAELAYPVMILNNELKICFKNEFCINRLVPARMGSGIKNYVSHAELLRISRMNKGDTIRISMEFSTLCWAFVFFSGDYYLLGIRTLTATLQNRICELIDISGDLTNSVLCQINTITSVQIDKQKSISELIKNKSNRIIRAQQHISEFLRIINGVKNAQAHLCDINSVLNSIIPSLRDTLRPLGVQIIYNPVSSVLSNSFAYLCEPDFNMVICLALYNAIQISQSEKVQVDINAINGNLYISVETDTVLTERIVKFICDGDYEEESFRSPNGWLYFELLLTKKLCEYYFWTIKTSAPGSDYRRIQTTILIPLEQGEGLGIRVRDGEQERQNAQGVVAIEFADIIDSYNQELL